VGNLKFNETKNGEQVFLADVAVCIGLDQLAPLELDAK
jgi:hypothetical protein